MHVADMEGIARELHESTGSLLPVDAFELAHLCGLSLRGVPGSTGSIDLEAGIIRYPSRARPTRQHGVIAHELGHWALVRANEDHREEAGARYLAGAFMLPRATFVADLRETDWDLDALRARHPNASAEMIIVRMTQVSAACAWVWDEGKVRSRYGAGSGEDVSEIVDRVLRSELAERDGDVRAWPVIDGSFRRVLVVRMAA